MYVLPGGEAEQMLTQRGKQRVFLNSRKGFVKLALEHGKGLLSSTFRLNVSALCGVGGAFRGSLGVCSGCQGV